MNPARFRPAPSNITPPARYSFSLYPADLQVVNDLIRGLAQCGLKVDRTKVVRGLLHTTPELDLFACGVVQHREDALKPGPRETNNVEERFTIVLPVADMSKVERALAKLAAQHIKMNDSYVLRALLRRLPPVEALAPIFKKYLGEFPDGRSRTARAKKQANA